jgi:hypothetical protein
VVAAFAGGAFFADDFAAGAFVAGVFGAGAFTAGACAFTAVVFAGVFVAGLGFFAAVVFVFAEVAGFAFVVAAFLVLGFTALAMIQLLSRTQSNEFLRAVFKGSFRCISALGRLRNQTTIINLEHTFVTLLGYQRLS